MERNSGRPPTSFISNITSASGLRLAELIHRGRERDEMEELGETYRAPTFDPGDVDE